MNRIESTGHSLQRAGCLSLLALLMGSGAAMATEGQASDGRDIRTGWEIPSEGYADQPYVVVTKQGHWLCTLTTGRGKEGDRGQHIVATISTDRGRTWSKLIDIEPADGPEASWAMPLVTPGGRVYVLYDYNAENVTGRRADTLGWYCFKYSDDGGRTWSAKRYRLPVRQTAVDRANTFKGKMQMFWGIGKPIVVDGRYAIFAFSKIGRYLIGRTEGWFFRSDNVLTERDPEKVRWEMLPGGDLGLRSEAGGDIQEEQNLVVLADGSLFCMYRTTTGHPFCATSRDGGRTWSPPEPATYTPGGRRFRHPRACPRIWRTKAGRFLFWFHHHGGKSYQDRNPAWIVGGVEKAGHIHWSQPEVLLYDGDPKTRISYPDLIEEDGRYWITETQKTTARVHEIDPALLVGVWAQGSARGVAKGGCVLSLDAEACAAGTAPMPALPSLGAGGGLAIEMWLTPADLAPGQVVLDSRSDRGAGLAITTAENASLRLALNDGQRTAAWSSDGGWVEKGKRHHVVFIADGGPKLITVVIDGVLCDGTSRLPAGRGTRQYGWGRFGADLGGVSGGPKLRLAPSFHGVLHSLRLYRRPLRTSEAVAGFRAGGAGAR